MFSFKSASLGLMASLFTVSQASAFTADQKAEIVEIVRNAMKEDPSILTGAVASMQARTAKLANQQKNSALKKEWKQLSQAPSYTIRGNPNGHLTVVEFLDPRCGYCRRMLPPIKEWLEKEKDVRFVERLIPILGEASVVGAKAILAAGKLGKYNEMRDFCFQSSTLTDSVVTKFAVKLGLDKDAFIKGMQSADVEKMLELNIALAQGLHLDGTPCFVFGDQVVLPGALSLEQLRRYTKEALKNRS